MTAAQAEILMAAIADVATGFGPFRGGWPEVAETPAEEEEIKAGASAFGQALVSAVLDIQLHQPDVVARWRCK
jgi:hypothetical protein